MRSVDTLCVDREVQHKFLEQRRALEIGGVDRLRAAVGLNSGAEEIGGVAVDGCFDAEGRTVGGDVRGNRRAVDRDGQRNVERLLRMACCIGQAAALENVAPSDQPIASLANTEFERRHELACHQFVREIGGRPKTLTRQPPFMQQADALVRRIGKPE